MIIVRIGLGITTANGKSNLATSDLSAQGSSTQQGTFGRVRLHFNHDVSTTDPTESIILTESESNQEFSKSKQVSLDFFLYILGYVLSILKEDRPLWDFLINRMICIFVECIMIKVAVLYFFYGTRVSFLHCFLMLALYTKCYTTIYFMYSLEGAPLTPLRESHLSKLDGLVYRVDFVVTVRRHARHSDTAGFNQRSFAFLCRNTGCDANHDDWESDALKEWEDLLLVEILVRCELRTTIDETASKTTYWKVEFTLYRISRVKRVAEYAKPDSTINNSTGRSFCTRNETRLRLIDQMRYATRAIKYRMSLK